MSSLDKRLAYLGLADFDYLAARILLLSGLGNSGFAKAAEAFEKLLKLMLMLEAKITRNEELDPKELKTYSHDILKLFHEVKGRIGAQFDTTWDEYFEFLRDSYSRRYPEHWKEFRLEVDIDKLDKAYAFLRGNVVPNFPAEEQDRVQQFGTFLGDAYPQEIIKFIKSRGVLPPGEALRLHNKHLDEMKISKSKM